MHYEESLNRLLNLDPAPKFGLERMQQLISVLNNPQQHYQILHVAGTNGKGSTCAFLDSILEQAGISRGRYTSPHLQCARERILINGQLISEKEFCEVEAMVNEACLQLDESPSFFERMTAVALISFQRAGIKLAILEVGLGGRLDATNVVLPTVCGITRIDIDHARILGDSVAKIASEKAGILKKNVPVVSDVQIPEAMAVIENRARQMQSLLLQVGLDVTIEQTHEDTCVFYRGKLILPKCKPGLLGSHQIHNAAVAVAMIELSGLVPDLNARKLGIESAKWMGRYETVNTEPLLILDGAHNPAGTQVLIETIASDKRLSSLPKVLVVGMTDGHDIQKMAEVWRQLLPHQIIVTQAKVPRALPVEIVAAAFLNAGFEHVLSLSESKRAVQEGMRIAQEKKGAVFVAGSLYLVGEVRSLFCEMPRDPNSPHY